MSDTDVNDLFAAGLSDWDQTCAQIRETLASLAREDSALLDDDVLRALVRQGLALVGAVQGATGDVRPLLGSLDSVSAGVSALFEDAAVSTGGWYQLTEQLDRAILTLRDLT